MYLIDTSIWIDYLRQEKNAGVTYLEEILKKQRLFGITGLIYQEILQGASSTKDLTRLIEYLAHNVFTILYTILQVMKMQRSFILLVVSKVLRSVVQLIV